MTLEEKLLDICKDTTFHDGALECATYCDGILELVCFCWMTKKSETGLGCVPESSKIVKLRFFGVRELEIFDVDKRTYVPYYESAFDKNENDGAILGINDFDFQGEQIVFEECIRFLASDVEIG